MIATDLRRMPLPRILAISGSTRADSTNSRFIRAIASLAAGRAEVSVYPSIMALPHFNPDDDIDPAPGPVAEFRRLLRASDGILICTPEYAMGVPGSLKNALDWTVSSSDLSGRPVMLVTASLGGEKSHASLLGTLGMIEAKVADGTAVLVPFARTKVDAEGRITDPEAKAAIERALTAFISALG